MMILKAVRPLGLAMVALMALTTLDMQAQSYRGKRAGRANAMGRVNDCNLAGTVFMEVNRAFGMVDGGRCVLNGSRFELSEPSGAMGPYVPLEGLDLRHSSWVAVDFLTPPVLRYTDATQANFSAINMDGDAVEMVDATGFIATKAKFHGAQMASWFVQGAFFDEADFSSASIVEWTTDALAYDGLYETAPESERAMSAKNARFEIACGGMQPLRRRLRGRVVLAHQVHRRLHFERRQFRQRHDGPNRLHRSQPQRGEFLGGPLGQDDV